MANDAPGWPGIPARWTSSAKSAVGTALAPQSRVWYTLSHGILNEIYYPRVDYACTRDFGFIVTNGRDYFSEEKRHARSTVRPFEDGVPAFCLTNVAADGRYLIEKTVLSDPGRDVVLQRIAFRALDGSRDYRLFALLSPHLVNRGADNDAWLADYKGKEMLFAAGSGNALALGCSAPWRARSVGFVGFSDGWQDLRRHCALRWRYDSARGGNVALTAEIDLDACGGEFVIALGFGRRSEEAAHRVIGSLADGFDAALGEFTDDWHNWQAGLMPLDAPRNNGGASTYRIGTAVVRSHEASSFSGGFIASLSIPWGYARGDEDLGGYHLVWPRDLVETAGALVAAGAFADAGRVLRWLEATQEADGHWPQNCWLDGEAYWNGVQMDECAFPILLVDLLWREGGLTAAELRRYWPMVRKAAQFVTRNGPVTGQDRWEEDAGYSPFTLAVEIAALLAAADIADHADAASAATYLRETADSWNDQIERWIYVTNTSLAREVGVDGYYVRIAPPDTADACSPADGFVPIKNRPPDQNQARASLLVSPDALALVRFGLRAPDDPRIRNTVRVIDALLKVDLPGGPCWRRYNGDGYGEHEDGRPYDGTGIGRPWPLLTGERAHYELAAGNRAEAERLLAAMEAFASDGHLIPEQVWDGDDIPERELFRGRPSGSAMPLVWAHAEHIKLLRSLREERVFDMPPQPYQRYQVEGVRSRLRPWRLNLKCRGLEAGKILRVELPNAALVHWSSDGWRSTADAPTRETPFGTNVVDLDTENLASGGAVVMTFYWPHDQRWEGTDYRIDIV
ncbi:MAG TPA: glucan 1,4-alpha-glucosidase [Stellaceae bacterium]|jgi:glucoamylase|nr:glucan 1,4-alpha-glucosidase [Stellaceae bacterium]